MERLEKQEWLGLAVIGIVAAFLLSYLPFHGQMVFLSPDETGVFAAAKSWAEQGTSAIQEPLAKSIPWLHPRRRLQAAITAGRPAAAGTSTVVQVLAPFVGLVAPRKDEELIPKHRFDEIWLLCRVTLEVALGQVLGMDSDVLVGGATDPRGVLVGMSGGVDSSVAARLLRELGYQVTCKQGDGYYGWPEYAPFDAIIVTAAADQVPPPLVRQLRDGGRLVIPVSVERGEQKLQRITKHGEQISVENIVGVVFVPFTRKPRECGKEDLGEHA